MCRGVKVHTHACTHVHTHICLYIKDICSVIFWWGPPALWRFCTWWEKPRSTKLNLQHKDTWLKYTADAAQQTNKHNWRNTWMSYNQMNKWHRLPLRSVSVAWTNSMSPDPARTSGPSSFYQRDAELLLQPNTLKSRCPSTALHQCVCVCVTGINYRITLTHTHSANNTQSRTDFVTHARTQKYCPTLENTHLFLFK